MIITFDYSHTFDGDSRSGVIVLAVAADFDSDDDLLDIEATVADTSLTCSFDDVIQIGHQLDDADLVAELGRDAYNAIHDQACAEQRDYVEFRRAGGSAYQ